MNVLIPTAGISNRLRPLTVEKPKTLLDVGDQPMLAHIMDACRDNGLKKFTLITGHGREHVEKFCGEYQEQHPDTSFKFIYNPHYHDKGNVYSVAIAKEMFAEPFIMIHADTLFHRDILKAVLESPHKNALAINDHRSLDEEQMKVYITEDGKITNIHKTLEIDRSDGEHIGVAKYHPDIAADYAKALDESVEEDDSDYYERAVQKMIDNGIAIHKVSTGGHPCMEVDTHEDFAEAQEMIKKCL